MAGLLVSVRSTQEALHAYRAGASVIDVKEPSNGPLGRASDETVRAIRSCVPQTIPVSMALGELTEIETQPGPAPDFWSGIAWRKLGFAGVGPDAYWTARWRGFMDHWKSGPGWIAVIYADWLTADTPHPDSIVEVAIECGCSGLLVDTWSKHKRSPLVANSEWSTRLSRVRDAGLLLVLAGGLDETRFEDLAPLQPDLFAVRGGACQAGRRDAKIDPTRVESLAKAASRLT